jgi:hypothetical protein
MSYMFNFVNMCANVKVPHNLFDMSNSTNMFVINVKVPHGLFNMTFDCCDYMYDYMELTNATS